MPIQSFYQKALKFAAAKHGEKNQLVPGTNLPYLVHVCNVAMEILICAPYSVDFDLKTAVQIALLHDTMEDTSTTLDELMYEFGAEVSLGVSALTKSESLPKEKRMMDSLHRIKSLPKEVWAVKLADRITNLQKPPANWKNEKRIEYQLEAKLILKELAGGNDYLEARLEELISEYGNYIKD